MTLTSRRTFLEQSLLAAAAATPIAPALATSLRMASPNDRIQIGKCIKAETLNLMS